MSQWSQNLFSNLLVVGVLLALAIIIYCKVTNKTIGELIKDLRSVMKGE